ncbi:diacylglycerol/lipid kinase family protein [Chloroflexota bacterium]
MSNQYARAIVNPASRGSSTLKEWPLISRHLNDKGLLFDYVFTEGAGHAIELTKQAINEDCRYIIAVGGDGTVHEVVNGIINSDDPANTFLGIISSGTTCSFARSIGIPPDPIKSCNSLISQNTILVDVGVVQCWSQEQLIQRYFVNEASAGFSAEIVDNWKYLPPLFGHSVNLALRTVAGYKSLATHRNQKLSLYIGDEVESINCCSVFVANGRYLADGMQIAPHASLDDGLLDVVIIGDVSKSELLKIRPKLYNGSHIKHAKIREKKATTITIKSEKQLLVEVDGEMLGNGPVTFSILPSALQVVI